MKPVFLSTETPPQRNLEPRPRAQRPPALSFHENILDPSVAIIVESGPQSEASPIHSPSRRRISFSRFPLRSRETTFELNHPGPVSCAMLLYARSVLRHVHSKGSLVSAYDLPKCPWILRSARALTTADTTGDIVSLARRLLQLIGWRKYAIALVCVTSGAPLVVIALIDTIASYSAQKDPSIWEGVLLSLAVLVVNVGKALAVAHLRKQAAVMRVDVFSFLAQAIQKRTLKGSTAGSCPVQLVSTDAMQIADDIEPLCSQLDAFASLVAASVFLAVRIRLASILITIVIVLIPLNALISKLFSHYWLHRVESRDHRNEIETELIPNLRVLKMYGWVTYMTEKIFKLREVENAFCIKVHATGSLFALAVLGATIVIQIPVLAVLCGSLPMPTTGFTSIWDHSPGLVYQVIALVNIIVWSTVQIPAYMNIVSRTRCSLRRLEAFLNSCDSKSTANVHVSFLEEQGSIVQACGKFSYPNTTSDFVLDADFSVREGEFAMIVGAVGSGKSSVINALLGRLVPTSRASVALRGSVSYCPQKPWLIAGTIQANILLDQPLNQERYQNTIRAACLEADLLLLPKGDQTTVSFGGSSLSGGQRQRIAIARCLYREAAIYIFDDPLSALDPHVAVDIFDSGLTTMLKDKTRIMVTHQLGFLPMATSIFILEDGKTTKEDLPLDLCFPVDRNKFSGKLVDLLEAWEQTDRLDLVKNDSILDRFASVDSKQSFCVDYLATGSMLAPPLPMFAGDDPAGCVRTDSISVSKFLSDARRDGRCASKASMRSTKVPRCLGSLSSNELTACSTILAGSNFWGEQPKPRSIHNVNCQSYHSARSLSNIPAVDRRSICLAPQYVEVALEGKEKAMVSSYALLGRYFVTYGGLLFSIALFLLFGISVGSQVVSQLWLGRWIDRSTPENLSDSTVLLIYACFLVCGLVTTSLQELLWTWGLRNSTKNLYTRLLSTAARAMPSHFSDKLPIGDILTRFTRDVEVADYAVPVTLHEFISVSFIQMGALIAISATIPIFAIVAVILVGLVHFIKPTQDQITLRHSCDNQLGTALSIFPEIVDGETSIKTFNLRGFYEQRLVAVLDALGTARFHERVTFEFVRLRLALLMSLVSGLAVLAILVMHPSNGIGSISPALAAFVISQSLQLTGFVSYYVEQLGNLVLSLNSVDRLGDFDNLPREERAEAKAGDPDSPDDAVGATLSISHLFARYSPEAPLVLKNISLEFQRGHKIGICGRTGSGKSSLLQALLCLLLPESGAIYIDGADISQQSCAWHRRRVGVIPQEALLLHGTVKANVDPLDECDDEVIWDALKRTDLIGVLEDTLLASGQPLETAAGRSAAIRAAIVDPRQISAGQRHLLCLVRVLARPTRIVIIDELTSSIDFATEQLITKIVENDIRRKSTLIIVAHRIQTIIDSDKVLVLDAGEVAEFESPNILLQNSDSIFYGLAHAGKK